LKPYQTLDGGDWDNNNNNSNSNNPNSDPQRQAYLYIHDNQDPNDPTSNHAKDEFASANDPANPVNQDHRARQAAGDRDQDQDRRGDRDRDRSDSNGHNDDQDFYTPNPDVHDPQDSEHKKSWLGQKYASYQSAKRGSGPSDEDVMKYTGRDRDELNDWARDRPGVGGNQDAGRVGSDSGLAAGASWN
jgi:hypothetical protein